MSEGPWILPALARRRWGRVDLDALARADFPATEGTNPLNDPVVCGEWVRRVAARAGAHYCWGGWLEDRAHLWRGHYLPTGCTTHLGIDLNAPAETLVLSPVSGEVVLMARSHAPVGGWGGWLVVRADRAEGGAAYVLIGHLAHAGLPPAGARITRGASIGVIGSPEENGGWHPHLHLQAITGEAWEAVSRAPDLLLDGYSYPGAALRRLYPDPAPLTGLASVAIGIQAP